MKHSHCLFLFRRDLRLQDNLGLLESLKNSQTVSPLFIFNPKQILPKNNPYFSAFGFKFLLDSIEDVSTLLQKEKGVLSIYLGDPCEVLDQIRQKLISTNPIDAIYFNQDYTPFSIERDLSLENWGKKHQIIVKGFHDTCLIPPGQNLKPGGTPYTIFTPFYKRGLTHTIPAPQQLPKTGKLNFAPQTLPNHQSLEDLRTKITKLQSIPLPQLTARGGRIEGIRLLKNTQYLVEYPTLRNIPNKQYTSHLSPYLKFGNVSAREAFHFFNKTQGPGNDFSRELFWRDFFTHISWHFPSIYTENFQKKTQGLTWKNNPEYFLKWCEGKTGFPIVDAGMRQLNATGQMHGRARMVTASFLIKNLHVDWKWGEKYFASKLVDYDPAVNNGNWQWVASTGCDAQPYFRVFNPWLQQQKFDPEAIYIKQWIPELKNLSAKQIHAWETTLPLSAAQIEYPAPMVDYRKTKDEIVKQYKKLAV